MAQLRHGDGRQVAQLRHGDGRQVAQLRHGDGRQVGQRRQGDGRQARVSDPRRPAAATPNVLTPRSSPARAGHRRIGRSGWTSTISGDAVGLLVHGLHHRPRSSKETTFEETTFEATVV